MSVIFINFLQIEFSIILSCITWLFLEGGNSSWIISNQPGLEYSVLSSTTVISSCQIPRKWPTTSVSCYAGMVIKVEPINGWHGWKYINGNLWSHCLHYGELSNIELKEDFLSGKAREFCISQPVSFEVFSFFLLDSTSLCLLPPVLVFCKALNVPFSSVFKYSGPLPDIV